MDDLFSFGEWKRRPRMGRVQGGARAAFATLSWGPARKTYFLDLSLNNMVHWR